MDASPVTPDDSQTPSPEEDGLSVLVTLSQTGQRGWLWLAEGTLTVDPALSATGRLVAVDVEDVVVLSPKRRFTVGQLMGLIPALLFGLVAIVVTIVAAADPHEADPGTAGALWFLTVVSLAPTLPFLLRRRTTARLVLGDTGVLLEFWYWPGSPTFKALDAFFSRLFRLQGHVTTGAPAVAPPLPREMGVEVQTTAWGRPAWLELKGSLLVYQTGKAAGMTIYTPVEQVSVLPPGRRASTDRVVIGLIPSGLAGLLAAAFTVEWAASGILADATVLAVLWGLFVCTVLLAVSVMRHGRPTARLRLGDYPRVIEFWHTPGVDTLIDVFFERLREAVQAVNRPATISAIRYVRPTPPLTPRAAAILTVLLALPAVLGARLLGTPLPLLVLLLPIGFYAYRRRGRIREIVEMKRASAHWRRGEHMKASDCLAALLARQPRYLPAWRMLVDLHLSCGEYDEAFECCNAMEALGVLDAPVADGVRQYVATRQELDERWNGAGFRATSGRPASQPPPLPHETAAQTLPNEETAEGE
ncbi:MAG: hypothetical protein JW889_01180 [Verrucomicrobia bacterium]|nr:hypothetical protein [Verrucomicrobiota bacterium]